MAINQQALDRACDHLRRGHVIAYPTEAVWGLGCDPFNAQAVQRLLAIKQRSLDKGLLLVASGIDQIAPLLENLSPEQKARLDQTWPGPVTWLLPDPDNVYPDWIKGQYSSVAIRVSAHPLVQTLCRRYGKPVVSTSANTTGEPEIRSRTKLASRFAGIIDYILDGELGDATRPSEIRDLLTGRTIR